MPTNTDRKWFLTKTKKACRKYQLIENGDCIAVGLSGGKDSSALLYIMKALEQELPLDFTIKPIFIDLGWNIDTASLKDYCSSLSYELNVINTRIKDIVFETRKEENPCALCANLRRGALNKAALDLGCSKVALGHHLDDVIETLFLNIIFTGKIATFKPKSFLDKKKITLIRPMVYLEEKTIEAVVEKKELPKIENPCPVEKKTKREEIKKLIEEITSKHPDFKRKFLRGLINFQHDNLW